jgi:hypothetical protein
MSLDVLIGKIQTSPGECVEIYLRTIRGERVISFETLAHGERAKDGTQIGVAHLGKLQPLIGSAVVRAEDEQRSARW